MLPLDLRVASPGYSFGYEAELAVRKVELQSMVVKNSVIWPDWPDLYDGEHCKGFHNEGLSHPPTGQSLLVNQDIPQFPLGVDWYSPGTWYSGDLKAEPWSPVF